MHHVFVAILKQTTALTYDICAFFYDSHTCNSHVDDIDTHVEYTQVDAHVDDIIYVKYY